VNEIKSWQEEQRAAYLYKVLAQIEAGSPRAHLFTELAGEAGGQ